VAGANLLLAVQSFLRQFGSWFVIPSGAPAWRRVHSDQKLPVIIAGDAH